MKKLAVIFAVLVMLTFCVQISAADPTPAIGEVLYHQNFGDIKNFVNSGITVGTAGSQSADVYIANNNLYIITNDNDRFYLILPIKEKEDSYTVEFSFRFNQKDNSNAFIGFILTCRGEEPTNITSVTIRAGGTVDEFSATSDEIKNAVANGEKIYVKIPIKDGVLDKIELSSKNASCVIKRQDILLIDNGYNGFAVRNSEVEISDVYIVNGVGYTKKTGYYAENSYIEELADESDENHVEEAPATGEYEKSCVFIISAASFGISASLILKKNSRFLHK